MGKEGRNKQLYTGICDELIMLPNAVGDRSHPRK